MERRRGPELIQTYIVPLALAVVILAVSQLLNLVKISNLLIGSCLVGIMLCGLYLAQFAAFKSLRLQERDALYGILSTVSFSGSYRVPTAGILTQGDVVGIEASAREVWIYAYDLSYENLDRRRSIFTNAVIENLSRGVKYRYLISNSEELRMRAERLERHLRRFAKSAAQIEFRVASHPPIFSQFSVTLYNPDTLDRCDSPAESEPDVIAVYFPHREDFASESDGSQAPFISIRDSAALRVQEKFETLFKESRPLQSTSGPVKE